MRESSPSTEYLPPFLILGLLLAQITPTPAELLQKKHAISAKAHAAIRGLQGTHEETKAEQNRCLVVAQSLKGVSANSRCLDLSG